MSSSPLTPNESNLLFLLGIGVMAERTGSDAETAEDQLDAYPLTIRGDDHDVVLEVAGNVLVRAPRAWLAELNGHPR